MTDTNTRENAAYIRDGALVLYFDRAEKPVLARFDLDTLAQASFEVSAKDKDGFYTVMLYDFSGEAQPVAQFASKGDAHQALYAILQALLHHKGGKNKGVKPDGVKGWAARAVTMLAKLIMYVSVLLVLLVAGDFVYFNYIKPALEPAPANGAQQTAVPPSQETEADPAASLPEGEAVSADEFLSTLPGQTSFPSFER